VPAGESDNGQQRGEADIDEREVSQRHSRPESDGEAAVTVGVRHSGEAERVNPPPPTPPIPDSGEPDGMRTLLSLLLPLIVSSDNTGTSTVPDPAPEVLHPDESVGTGAASDKNKPNWKSTASASAKLLLRGVRDSADAFGPLKSVAGGLCFILENHEVRSTSRIRRPQHLQSPQRTKANEQAIESLAPRVKALAELLDAPVSEGDVKERERRNELER